MHRTIAAAIVLCLGLSLVALAQNAPGDGKPGEPKAGGAKASESPAPAPYVKKTFGPSFRDRADAAWEAKDYGEAIYWLRRAVEATPKDSNAWYNLACDYALTGQSAKAIDALETAVDAGFDDAGHVATDPDLASITKDPRFVAAVERAKGGGNAEAMTGTERRHVAMTSLGTYLAFLPPEHKAPDWKSRKYPLCVILHGNGSSEIGHGAGMTPYLGRDGVIYVAVRAPYPNWGAFSGTNQPGYTAWPPESEEADDRRTGPAGQPHPMATYCNWIDACVDDAVAQYPVDPSRIYVIGHSQGAAATAAYSATHAKRVKAAFVYAGYATEEVLTPDVLKGMKDAGTKVTVAHCRKDNNVPFEKGEALAKLLAAAGVPVETKYFDLATHGFAQPVRDAAAEWVAKTVRGA
jgi:predicted esterase